MPFQRSPSLVALAAALTISAAPAPAQDFYAGKTVELIVGGGAGGGYDIYARTVARHVGRFIPGNPTIVVKNMPGASSNKAAQYITAIAPKDGTSIGAIMPGAIMGPLLDERAAPLFDPTKVHYIGTANSGTRVCVTLKGTKISTFEDAQRVKAKFGGSGPNDSTYEYGHLHRNTSGAAYDMVAGYRGTPDMALALERGEIDGICGIDWTTLKAQRQHWIKNKQINVLVQTAFRKDPDLPDVPLIMDLTKDPEKLQILKLYVSSHEFARPFAAPPGIPADRAAALIAAFEATTKDPGFLAETAKHQMEVAPVSGKKLAGMLAELYATPGPILAKARAAIGR